MAENNFLNNLLSRIIGTTKNEEKYFYRSRVDYLGQKGAAMIDTKIPAKIYNEITELNQVINKKADMFSNGVFKLIDDESGEPLEDEALFALLKQPNILQAQNKWLKQYLQQFEVYGNQFIYGNKPSGLSKYPSSLANISPAYLEPILTGKIFQQTEIKGIIKKYIYCEGDNKIPFETESILWTKNDDIDNPLVGVSPLKSLQFPLSNTELAYKYLNIISGEKGAIGMVATTQKDSMGAIPMSKEDKLKVENAYTSDYGVGDDKKARVVMVDGSVAWLPTSYPTKELLLLEQIDANKLTIVDHFGLNINIFSSKNQTFENVRNALIQSYNDAVIPFADAFTQSLSGFLKIEEGQSLILDYSHLGILQDDEGSSAEVLKKQLDSVVQAVQARIITPAQAQEIYNNSFGLTFTGGVPIPPTE